MKLRVLGSSSNGNCYVLDNGGEALIIEAGVKFTEVKKALDFNLSKVVGCIISHQHGDHAKYIKAMVDCGFYTLALPEVWAAKQLFGQRTIAIVPYKGYKLGNFKIVPFPACHDVPCVGYLIEHPACGRLLFLTDSCMCENTFKGLDNIMVECNYSHKSLVKAIKEGRTPLSQRERLLTSHMELGTCKEFLTANDLTNVANIVLLHLSENNSDEPYFVSEIERQTGKMVYAAYPGMVLDIDKI